MEAADRALGGRDYVAGGPAGAANNRRVLRLVLSVLAVAVFYYPALIDGARNAGFLYKGDNAGFYVPMILKVHALVHDLNFTAIDYSIYNGSSDFFLSPNFFTFHPLLILYCLAVPSDGASVQSAGQLVVWMMAFHSVLALHFTQRATEIFLKMSPPAALFCGAMFTFSLHMVHALVQPPFFFVVSVLPWLCYAVVGVARKPSTTRAVVAAIPVVLVLVGGYVPLGLGAFGFAMLLGLGAALYTGNQEKVSWPLKARKAALTAVPLLLGAGVCAPYLVSLYFFHQETGSANVPSVFYSAHQLSDSPASLLRGISGAWIIPGPFYEFSVVIGPIVIAITAMFLFSLRAADSLNRAELLALKISIAVFALGLLAAFGTASVVSDLLFYFVPEVGKMHIYQRFLPFGHLALAVASTIMLTAVIRARPTFTIRVVFSLLVVSTLAGSYFLAFEANEATKVGFSPAIVVEIFGAVLVTGTLFFKGRSLPFLAAALMSALPAMDRLYDLTQDVNAYAIQSEKQPLYLKANETAALVEWIKTNTSKPYPKYVDVTPMWSPKGVETFPKVFPYLVLGATNLSSYTGFTFYLSSRADYRRRMPIDGEVKLVPDWTIVTASGADFAIADRNVASSIPDAVVGSMFGLPNGAGIVPLAAAKDRSSTLFDNGMISVSRPSLEPQPESNLARYAAATQSSTVSPATLAIDGNRDGNFANGSVSHTTSDPNAWLELDLGSPKSIGLIRVWNRTDCCQSRLQGFWAFVSNAPFAPSDTAHTLQHRDGTKSYRSMFAGNQMRIPLEGIGRYVRIQLDGSSPRDQAFLHIAEVEVFGPEASEKLRGGLKGQPVFYTNFANRLTLDLENTEPVEVRYLFTHNPRLTYRVDGKAVAFDVSGDVPTYLLPSGDHRVEISYHHPLLMIFWVTYAVFWFGAAIAFCSHVWRRVEILRQRPPS